MSAMYYKDHQIVNIYIYKYVRTCIYKFSKFTFFGTISKTKTYLFVRLK